jgi:hypothetical protein
MHAAAALAILKSKEMLEILGIWKGIWKEIGKEFEMQQSVLELPTYEFNFFQFYVILRDLCFGKIP